MLPKQERNYLIDLKETILRSDLENISVKVSKEDLNQVPQWRGARFTLGHGMYFKNSESWQDFSPRTKQRNSGL